MANHTASDDNNKLLPNEDNSIKNNIVNELFKPKRINFIRRQTEIHSLHEYQADLMFMLDYASENNGYKYALIMINVLSKYVYAVPLKTKLADETGKAFESIFSKLDETLAPHLLQTDMGTEFKGKCSTIFKKYKIKHYTTYSTTKAAICERVIRTLKRYLYKEMQKRSSRKWVNFLSDVVLSYNSSRHRATRYAPIDVNIGNYKVALANINKLYARHIKKPRAARGVYKVGDYVRISLKRYAFEKSYFFNYTGEIFRISKVNNTKPITFNLEDSFGAPILGCFYKEEISKTQYPDIYLIDEVKKRKKDKLYVSWLGFSDKHNSWIKSTDIQT